MNFSTNYLFHHQSWSCYFAFPSLLPLNEAVFTQRIASTSCCKPVWQASHRCLRLSIIHIVLRREGDWKRRPPAWGSPTSSRWTGWGVSNQSVCVFTIMQVDTVWKHGTAVDSAPELTVDIFQPEFGHMTTSSYLKKNKKMCLFVYHCFFLRWVVERVVYKHLHFSTHPYWYWYINKVITHWRIREIFLPHKCSVMWTTLLSMFFWENTTHLSKLSYKYTYW